MDCMHNSKMGHRKVLIFCLFQILQSEMKTKSENERNEGRKNEEKGIFIHSSYIWVQEAKHGVQEATS